MNEQSLQFYFKFGKRTWIIGAPVNIPLTGDGLMESAKAALTIWQMRAGYYEPDFRGESILIGNKNPDRLWTTIGREKVEFSVDKVAEYVKIVVDEQIADKLQAADSVG